MILTLNNYQLEKEIRKSSKVIILEIGAKWCGSCFIMEPVLNQLAMDYNNNILIARLDIEKGEKIIKKFGVNIIPTYLFFRYGQLLDKVIGSTSKVFFSEKIDSLIDLSKPIK